MATKKELEARIAALEAEMAILKAQRPIQVLPRPADLPWPQDQHPRWQPLPFTINVSSTANPDELRRDMAGLAVSVIGAP